MDKPMIDQATATHVDVHEDIKLTDGHQQALAAADAFFGAFCILMLAVSIYFWWTGTGSWVSPVVIFAFLLSNVALSVVSQVAKNPYAVEMARPIVGAIVCPMAYVLVDGPIAPWWPGFLIMSLGGAVVLGLLTGKPIFGRVLVGYYIGVMFISARFLLDNVDWTQWILQAGVIAMTGLMFATIMSVLGQTLMKEREQSEALREVRDALFAEVEIAQEIQTLLLPTDPRVPDHAVSGRMIPAEEVGGDYYDVLTMDGRAFLAIGDVSGHGLTAGLTMMMARSSLLGALEANPTARLGDIYRVLNRCLVRNLTRMGVALYMTFNLIEYLGEGRFIVVGLHLPLIVYRKATNTIEEYDSTGMWLGLVKDIKGNKVPELAFRLERGDLLVMYTDGIIETFKDDEMFGFDRLTDGVQKSAPQGPEAVINHILAELKAFTTEPADDDITMLVVNHHGAVAAA